MGGAASRVSELREQRKNRAAGPPAPLETEMKCAPNVLRRSFETRKPHYFAQRDGAHGCDDGLPSSLRHQPETRRVQHGLGGVDKVILTVCGASELLSAENIKRR